jgi:hypothetical protein
MKALASNASRQTVQLNIERLVLDGFELTRVEAERLQAALETELAELLSVAFDRGLILPDGAVPSLPPRSIQLATGVRPAEVGRQIAGAVAQSLAPAADETTAPSTTAIRP